MVQRLKQLLMEDDSNLIRLLGSWGFCHIKKHNNYISFGRSDESSPKSIVIYLDNDNCIVHDYPKNFCSDIIGFIMNEKGASFIDVLNSIKSILGITSDDNVYDSVKPFGGMFSKVRKTGGSSELERLDESVLDKFKKSGNVRFMKDGISLQTQRAFNIGFDVENQAITIPIYLDDGSLIGVKCRINRDPKEDESKYYYCYPCPMTMTLYGFNVNYKSLYNAEIIYVFESEKSVMQAYDMGYCNCIAMGSSHLSKQQCRLISSLNPKKVAIMHDEGIDDSVVKSNCEQLRKNCPMQDFDIYVWEPGIDVGDKCSPTDMGKERFEEAIESELVVWE